MISKVQIIVLCALLAVIGGQWHLLSNANYELAAAEVTITDITDKNVKLATTLQETKQSVNELTVLRMELEQKNSESQKTIAAKTSELIKYRNRQDVVFKKPGLVQRMEQKALDKFFDEVSND